MQQSPFGPSDRLELMAVLRAQGEELRLEEERVRLPLGPSSCALRGRGAAGGGRAPRRARGGGGGEAAGRGGAPIRLAGLAFVHFHFYQLIEHYFYVYLILHHPFVMISLAFLFNYAVPK